jgi:hypothetical protein
MPTKHTDYQVILAAHMRSAALLRASLITENYRLTDTTTSFQEAYLALNQV